MNLKKIALPLILSLSFLFVACQESTEVPDNGGVESEIEGAGEDAGDAIEGAGEDAGDAIEDAENATEEGINDAGDAIEDAGDSVEDATN